MNKTKKIRILQLIESLEHGGAEVIVVNLVNNLNAEKFESAICSLNDKIPLQARLNDANKDNVFTCGKTYNKPRILSSFNCGVSLRKAINEYKPHLINSHLYGYGTLFQLIATKLGNIPNIATMHTTGMHYGSKGNPRLAICRNTERIVLRVCGSSIVAVSSPVAEMAKDRLGIPSSKIETITSGIDTDYFDPTNDTCRPRSHYGYDDLHRIVINVGNLHNMKGHRYLVRAWGIIAAKNPQARLIIVGDGHLRSELENLAEELGVRESIWFAGTRDDVRNLLYISDLGVMPSTHEGLALAVLEMMSMGLPTVLTDLPAFRKYFAWKNAGLIVPTRDPLALADGILQLLGDEPTLKKMGENARNLMVNEYSLPSWARHYEQLYEKVIFSRRNNDK